MIGASIAVLLASCGSQRDPREPLPGEFTTGQIRCGGSQSDLDESALKAIRATELVGKTEAQADAVAQARGCHIAIVQRDGKPLPITAVVDPSRIQAVSEDGVLIALVGTG